jgi:hypothetical protein
MVRDYNIGSAVRVLAIRVRGRDRDAVRVRAIRVRGRDRDAGRRAGAGIAGRSDQRQGKSLVYYSEVECVGEV